jgi:hypothetical protein
VVTILAYLTYSLRKKERERERERELVKEIIFTRKKNHNHITEILSIPLELNSPWS